MKIKRNGLSWLAMLLAVALCVSACVANTDPTGTSSQSTASTSSVPSSQSIPSGSTESIPTIPSGTTIPSGGTIPSNTTLPTASSSIQLPPDVQLVTVRFVAGQGMDDIEQILEVGAVISQPVLNPVQGKIFGGWYADPDFFGKAFDFSQPVYENLTLYAKWTQQDEKITYSYAGNESASFEWQEKNPADCKVGYRPSGKGSYTYVDAPLIRAKDSTTARVDVLGLAGGGHYDFIIETSAGDTILVENMAISAYDRSGYAHFNYTEGVGAYHDDGTLKSGALVIYLTEDNKNNVLSDAYVNGKQVDIAQYMSNGTYTGIGELLNNYRYSGSDRFNVGIAKLCEVYGAVTIRVLGKVTAQQNSDGTSTIIGLTDYNSRGNGGSPGDNGRMARMVNAKNLTVEGVGEDACIDGWGLHFISDNEGNAKPGAGESFEVRNLRFEQYPEDAVGMEGKQDGSTLTSPVQRCWIHHNSFYPGYCANPAESDKAEGDGSCDFKRGRYFTLSYNYFVDCHKTNLVGSGDSSLQYDITFHHNYWENCGSRIPLLRNANLHFYNNYISCDISMETGTTGSKLGLNYVSSVRANSFLFAEANYYDGCKNPVLTQSGGVVKAYNNTYYACFEDDMSTKVTNREDPVSNSCKYAAGGIDYSTFDTNPSLFYYNAAQKRSDCYLTDAVTARLEVMAKAGTQKRAGSQVNTNMNKYTPTTSLQMEGSELTVDLSNITAGTTVNGIYFNAKGSSKGLKGKNQVVTFTLLSDTEIQVAISDTGNPSNMGELVDQSGKVWAGKFTEFSGTLPAGTYFIGSGSKDKEVTITSLHFKNGMTPQQKLQAVIDAIDRLPQTMTLTTECKALLDYATAAYDGLSEAQKAQVTNVNKLTNAAAQYENLQNAQVQKLNTAILELPEPATAATQQALDALMARYQAAAQQYALLTTAQQSLVENYQKVTSGLVTLQQMQKPYKLQTLLNALPETLTQENVQAFLEVKALYDGLTSQERKLTAAQQSKYDSLLSQYSELQKLVIVAIFTGEDPSLASDAGFTVSGNYKMNVSFVYEGETYNNPLKMESATLISFTLADEMTVTLCTDGIGKRIKIDGTAYTTDDQGSVIVTLAAGTHTITKGEICNLCYIILTPVQ